LRERFEEKIVAVFLNRIAARSSWRPSRAMHEGQGREPFSQKQLKNAVSVTGCQTLAESQSPRTYYGGFIEDTRAWPIISRQSLIPRCPESLWNLLKVDYRIGFGQRAFPEFLAHHESQNRSRHDHLA
jgi:hypothetical protein